MELVDAVRSTGAVRSFSDERVDDATVYGLLDDARFAPSGGNRQAWRVAVVKDRDLRVQLGEAMRDVWHEYIARAVAGETPFTVVEPSPYRIDTPRASNAAPNPLLDGIADVPVVLVVAADLSRVSMMDKDLNRPPLAGGASIYPFCWNLLLAARARGLGGVITTFLSRAEPVVAPALGLPPNYALAATLFLGHPVHQPTKLTRAPVEEFARINRFDGDPFVG